jgi:monoamine oxidase
MSTHDLFINPTDAQRHQLLLESLTRVGRAEDYQNVLDLLSPPPDIYQYAPVGSLKNKRIGIIGGGLAGLSAAYELRKLGAHITIFEAENNRIGGRVYTHYFDESKQYYGEFGPMRIPISHETTWHYINLFGLNTRSLVSPASNNFIYAHQTRIRRDFTGQNITEKLYPLYALTDAERQTPWSSLSSYASNAFLNSLSPQARTEILKILPTYSEEYTAITNLSNRQAFEMLGLSQGAINLLSAVEPFTAALLHTSHDEIMSGNYSLDFLNTYTVRGGMIHLPNAFYSSLRSESPLGYLLPSTTVAKVDFRFGHIVSGIFENANQQNINLRFTDCMGKEWMEAL